MIQQLAQLLRPEIIVWDILLWSWPFCALLLQIRKKKLPLWRTLRQSWRTPFFGGAKILNWTEWILRSPLSVLACIGAVFFLLLFYTKIPQDTVIVQAFTLFWRLFPAVFMALLANRCTLSGQQRLGILAVLLVSQLLQNDIIPILLVLALLEEKVGERRVLRLYTIGLSLLYALCAGLSMLGIIENSNVTTAESRHSDFGWLPVRHGFGLCHPNRAGIYMAVLVALWLVLRRGRLRWWDFVLTAAGVGMVFFVIDSKGALLFFGVFLAVFLAAGCKGFFASKLLCGLTVAVPPVFCGVSIACGLFFRWDSPFWATLNRLSTGRISVLQQELQFPTWPTTDVPVVLDNGYVGTLRRCGWVLLAVLILLYCLLLFRLWQKKDAARLALTLGFLSYFLVENLVLEVINLTLLFLLDSVLLHRVPRQGLAAGAPQAAAKSFPAKTACLRRKFCEKIRKTAKQPTEQTIKQ